MRLKKCLISFLIIFALVLQMPLQGILAATAELAQEEQSIALETDEDDTKKDDDQEIEEELNQEDLKTMAEEGDTPVESAGDEDSDPENDSDSEDDSDSEEDESESEGTMVFQQVTNINQITSGNSYIIKVPGMDYALPVETTGAQTVQGVAIPPSKQNSQGVEQITVPINEGLPDYVLDFTIPSGKSDFSVSYGDLKLRLGTGSSNLAPLFNTGASGNIAFYQWTGSSANYFTVYNYSTSTNNRTLEYTQSSNLFGTYFGSKSSNTDLSSTNPIRAFEIWKEVSESTVTFQRISSLTQLQTGAQYLIRVPETPYVLQSTTNELASVSAFEVGDPEDIIGSPQQITTTFDFDFPNYIFTITPSNSGYTLSNAGSYLSLNSTDSLFTSSSSNIIQLNQPDPYAPSGFNLYTSQSDPDEYNFLFYSDDDEDDDEPGDFSIMPYLSDESTEDGYVFEIWINTASYIPNTPTEATTEGSFTRFSDMSNLANMGGFIMTFTYPGTDKTYVITSNNSKDPESTWYAPIDEIVGLDFSDPDTITIGPGEGEDTEETPPSPSTREAESEIDYYPIFQAKGYEGFNSSRYGYTSITNTNGQSWYPNNAFYGLEGIAPSAGSTPFRSNNVSRIGFSVDQTNENLQSTFNLRGNGSGTWLGYYQDETSGEYVFVNCAQDGQFYLNDVEAPTEATLLEIEIYSALATDSTYTVVFNVPTTEGDFEPIETISTNEYFTLPNAPDIYDGPEIPNLPLYTNLGEDGVAYTLLGWTTNPEKAQFLDLDDSVNHYDYIDSEGKGTLSENTLDDYEILGTGNPEVTQLAEAALLDEDNGEVELYAVYAVRGFDSAVAITDESGQNILGIADWKPSQGDTGYKNSEKEKWLGSINLVLYRDGVQWGETETLYFSYHNDKAADLNLKFIWDQYANDTTLFNNLYEYLSFVNKEGIFDNVINGPSYDNELVFPPYDQVGHYTIDGVIADQGGSEDGLKYAFNWMEDYGGQLDNVVGESTVEVYVTSVYQVRYYLVEGSYGVLPTNSNLIHEVQGTQWQNTTNYSTPGTQDLFNEYSEDVEYKVGTDPGEDLDALMNPTTYDVDDILSFKSSDMLRGDSDEFSYFIKKNGTNIPIAGNPNQSTTFTQLGATLNPQSASSWLMFGPNSQNPNKTLSYNSTFSLTGTTYGTEDTVYATDTDVEYEGTDPYIFNLYAFVNGTNPPGPTPPTPTPPEPSPTPTESLTITKQQALSSGEFTTEKLTALPGGVVRYALIVTNTGTADLSNITVSDPVPSGMNVILNTISDSGVYNNQENTVIWTIESLASGDSITLTFNVTLPTIISTTGKTFINTATADYNDTTVTSNPVTVSSTTPVEPTPPQPTPPTPTPPEPSQPQPTPEVPEQSTTPSQNTTNITTVNKTTNTTKNPSTGMDSDYLLRNMFIVVLIGISFEILYLQLKKRKITK